MKIYKNKISGGLIEIHGVTAFDFSSSFVGEGSAPCEFSLTRDELEKHWEFISETDESIIDSSVDPQIIPDRTYCT